MRFFISFFLRLGLGEWARWDAPGIFFDKNWSNYIHFALVFKKRSLGRLNQQSPCILRNFFMLSHQSSYSMKDFFILLLDQQLPQNLGRTFLEKYKKFLRVFFVCLFVCLFVFCCCCCCCFYFIYFFCYFVILFCFFCFCFLGFG